MLVVYVTNHSQRVTESECLRQKAGQDTPKRYLVPYELNIKKLANRLALFIFSTLAADQAKQSAPFRFWPTLGQGL